MKHTISEQELPYVVKQILNLYDVKIESYCGKTPLYININELYVRVKVIFTFYPKEINNITPHNATLYCIWDYSSSADIASCYDILYLRAIDMPILKYIDDYYNSDVFFEKIGKEFADEAIKTYKSSNLNYSY